MNQDLKDEARMILEASLELPPAEQAAFLEQRCRGEVELRQLVDRLKEHYELLGRPLVDLHPLRHDRKGETFGPFRLLSLVGRGGWADVYKATRLEDEFQQPVAVKILRQSHSGPAFEERFRTEGGILAQLRHPNIARLRDGGVTAEGEPYLAMEYVEGLPVDEYCETRELSVRDRLELFLNICDAVQYAHRNLIVHRDLKPSNIMVDGDGQPKLLDFGIAKLLPSEASAVVPETMADFAMTPEYASPEQVMGSPVTTATDVYSLGGVLYKVLTGSLPYRLDRGDSAAAVSVICEQEAVKPSVRVLTGRSVQGQAAGAKVRGLARGLRGAVDAILLKALRKSPEARYPSVEKLADDLRGYLNGDAIQAYRGSYLYRARRFVRRRRWEVVIAALLAVSLAVVSQQRSIALRQAEQARKEAHVAREVGNFLIDVFEASDPSEAQGQTVTAREILDSGTLRLEAENEFEPVVRGRLLDAVGRIYLNLGLYERAETTLRLGLETRRAAPGPQRLEEAESLTSLAALHRERHEFDRAEDLLRQALRIHRQSSRSDPRTLADTTEELGSMYLRAGRLAEAENWFRQALELRQNELLAGDPDLAKSWKNLGSVHQDQGLFSQAEQFYRQALDLWQEAYGPTHPYFIDTLNSLASLYRSQGRLGEAEDLHRQAIRHNEEVYGSTHPSLAKSYNNLANLLRDQGQYDEADMLYQRALTIWTAAFGPEHPDVGAAYNNRAELLRVQGELDEAEKLYRRACKIWLETSGPESSKMAICYHNLGLVATMRGDFQQAEQLSQQSCDLTKELLGDDHPELGICFQNLARLYAQQKKEPERQDRLYRRALSIFEQSFDRPHRDIAVVEASLANLLRGQGRFDEAELLYRSALDAFSRLDLAPYHAKALEYFRAFLLERGTRADLEEAARLADRED